MTIKQSNVAAGQRGQAYPAYAGHLVAQRFVYSIPAGGLSLNDIIEMCAIPVGCRVVDMVLDSDDLDSGTGIVFDVGIMSGAFGDTDPARTIGAEFFSGSTLGQAGGVARPTLKTAFRNTSSDTERSIGVKIATAAGTPAAGDVGLTVLFAAV